MIAKITSKQMLKLLAVGLTALAAPAVQAAEPAVHAELKIAPGPFQPSWESLGQYECPEWIRDAKFGMWAHWTAQCVPEMGDWYARGMYEQDSAQYKYHLAHYGHPSRFGFKDIDNLWKAEKWDPERLMDLYRRAGAKFFFALANHHDNFDCWDSKYQPWNSVRVGPHKDIVGVWAKAARARGMRFGVTVHASHAFRWFAVAHGSDKTGPLAGVSYDGTLTKADGKGAWWQGLDPQELYCKPPTVTEPCWSLDGADGDYVAKYFHRTKDLIDAYRPDLLMFDDDDLPFGEAGLRLAAHFYNANMQWHNGRNEAVINTRISQPGHMKAVVHMLEHGIQDRLEAYPWETATCIGEWHYKRGANYKTAEEVVRLLVDVVSKNGVLAVNVPLRGDGSIDDVELKFLHDMASWIAVNGEAIYGTRPWLIFGEGPTQVKGGQFNDQAAKRFTAADVRFTVKGEFLYAIAMAWPGRQAVIHCLANGSPLVRGDVQEIRLLGHDAPLGFVRDEQALKIRLPEKRPCEYAVAFKIAGLKANAAGLAAWEAAQKAAGRPRGAR